MIDFIPNRLYRVITAFIPNILPAIIIIKEIKIPLTIASKRLPPTFFILYRNFHIISGPFYDLAILLIKCYHDVTKILKCKEVK